MPTPAQKAAILTQVLGVPYMLGQVEMFLQLPECFRKSSEPSERSN